MDIQRQAFQEWYIANHHDGDIHPNQQLLEWSEKGGFYFASSVEDLWEAWQQAQKSAVPEGFVLVPEDQEKDTERLNFLLCGNSCIRTVVKHDIENEDYEKTGEHFLFTEVHWIDGWVIHENTSSQSERGAIDKAMIEAQEQN